MSDATPRPWAWYSAILKGRVQAEQLLIQPADGHEHPDDFSDIIAEIPWQHFDVNERTANAELIVRAVNAHDALLEAAEENYQKRHDYGMWIARLESQRTTGIIGSHTNPIEDCTSPGCVKNRAAIHLAKGNQP